MNKTFLVAVLALASAAPPVERGDGVVDVAESSPLSTTYYSVLWRSDLERAPKWDAETAPPPLSARKAEAAAIARLKEQLPYAGGLLSLSAEDGGWGVLGTSLLQAGSGMWYYKIEIIPLMPGSTSIPPDPQLRSRYVYSLFVTMDGRARPLVPTASVLAWEKAPASVPGQGKGPDEPADEQSQTACVACYTNMVEIWRLLKNWTHEGGWPFPSSLAVLASRATNTALFVSPLSGRGAGALADLDDWTDFIYVANEDDGVDPNNALLISPPENHGGRFGLVLWNGGEIDRVSPDETRRLIEAPWLRATNASPSEIENLRPTFRVRVPKGLRALYPHAYRGPSDATLGGDKHKEG
jgi:hypothetical protein